MKKIICFLLAFTMLFTFISCDPGYNAQYLYHYVDFILSEQFDSECETTYPLDANLPKTKTFIIKDQEELDRCFDKFPEVDFETQMVVVCCYTTEYAMKRINAIQTINFTDDGVLSFVFIESSKKVHKHTKKAIVLMDKLEVKRVEFEIV